LHDGDRIRIDANAREISTDANLEERRRNWQPPAPKATRGALAKFALLVASASDGATTDPAFPASRHTPSQPSPSGVRA
ncbi:MAG: dihydroxy-acid dehydratase, partial [Gemmatimonadaceae bacterium]